MNRLAFAALAALLVACNADIDEPWELDHDRIVAVRATPPAIQPGESSVIDLLAGYAGMPAETVSPDFVTVVKPMSLASTVAPGPTGWTVTAPSEDQLEAARQELGLAESDPVPLQLGVAKAWPTPVVSPNEGGFGATKVVWLGQTADNPDLATTTIDGAPPAPDDTNTIVVGKDAKTRLFVEADDTVMIVNWLTSAGTMHDFDLHNAYLTFEKDDPTEGQLALVVRDERGGVSWSVWNIRAE